MAADFALSQDEARRQIPELEAICRIRPNSNTLATLGASYFTIDRPQDALPLLQAAWDKNKDSAIGMNLALVLKDLGRHDESFHVIEHAYQLNPDDFYIRLGYGEALLKAGFWRQAWTIYDNARPTQQGAALNLRLPREIKEWNGEPLPKDHLLLVINEGGTGDRINYPRWLPMLTQMGINWKFYPYDELFSFFTRIFDRSRLVADDEDIPNPTHWTTTFALPAKLNVMPTEIPPPLPFTATAENIAKYKFNRVDPNVPVLGLCWQAAEMFQGGKRVRSLSEGQAMRLVCQTGHKVQWINLQHGIQMPHPIVNVQRDSWEELAGLMKNLDGVVSVDTGPMHLAGALGVPLATLLSGNSCWKFLRKGERDIWYPSAKLYRNEGHGFENAIDKLVLDIREGKFPR